MLHVANLDEERTLRARRRARGGQAMVLSFVPIAPEVARAGAC
jgi:hypothetical protein